MSKARFIDYGFETSKQIVEGVEYINVITFDHSGCDANSVVFVEKTGALAELMQGRRFVQYNTDDRAFWVPIATGEGVHLYDDAACVDSEDEYAVARFKRIKKYKDDAAKEAAEAKAVAQHEKWTEEHADAIIAAREVEEGMVATGLSRIKVKTALLERVLEQIELQQVLPVCVTGAVNIVGTFVYEIVG
jgi:hypothetical protein